MKHIDGITDNLNDIPDIDYMIDPDGICADCRSPCWYGDDSFDCFINGKPSVHRVKSPYSHCCEAPIIQEWELDSEA